MYRVGALAHPAIALHPTVLMPLILTLSDLDATMRLGERLASLVRKGDVVALSGGLGTGKTTLARAVIRALARRGDRAVDEVPSPTFTLVQTYDLPDVAVHHFDLYRVKRPDEVIELGIEDAFASGVSLIEWPERLGDLLPSDRLEIELRLGGTPGERIAVIHGHGAWSARAQDLGDD
jgi:tRNA threonylcarbamoyladenosine biosynthesis protein TsaE